MTTQEEQWLQWLQVFTDCKRAYQLVFNTPTGEKVLLDLDPFWCASTSCVAIKNGELDINRTLLFEGRREVYLRIRDYLDLTPEQLVKKFVKPAIGAQGQ